MLKAKDAVVWINRETMEVKVLPQKSHFDRRNWGDPIGAAYAEWHDIKNDQRVLLLLETAIDLAMQGFALKDVLTAFAQIEEFRALGSKSMPMCRALTKALIGRTLEPNTMDFEDLISTYAPKAT